MIDVRLVVLRSEDLNNTDEYTTVTLAGVPRVGDTVFAKNAEFDVRAVNWDDDGSVTLTVFSLKYEYRFPTVTGPA